MTAEVVVEEMVATGVSNIGRNMIRKIMHLDLKLVCPCLSMIGTQPV